MKNILFLASTMRRTGPTRQLLNLCRCLPAFSYRPSVLTLSKEPKDSLSDDFKLSGIETQSLLLSRIGSFTQAVTRIKQVARHLQPDVVHSSGIRSDILAHSASGEIPHVMTIRNSPWEDYPVKYGRTVGGIMAWRHLRLIKRAQHPVACSNSTARGLRFVRSGIDIVPNGVDTSAFRPAAAGERVELRRALGFDIDRPVIVSVGSLMARKRPDLLLNSFLSASMQEYADLVFIGTGRMRSQLERATEGLNAVKFRGQVTNVEDYLRCSDLFVSTSRAEGLPNSVLEAMACGLPVILSNIEPHRELMVHKMGCGELVDPAAEHDLALAFKSMLGADLVQLSRNARAHVEQNYSATRAAERYAMIYDSVSSHL